MRSPTSNFNIQLDLVPISFVKITPSNPLQTLVLKGQFGSLIDGYHIPYNNILKTHSKYIMNNKKKKTLGKAKNTTKYHTVRKFNPFGGLSPVNILCS